MDSLNLNRAQLALLRRIPPRYRYHARIRFYKLYRGYKNIADPYKILWVDPEKIKYVTTSGSKVDSTMGSCISESITHDLDRGRFSKVRIGSIKRGSWDKKITPFDDLYLPQAVEAHYRREVPWEETEFFDRYKKYLSFDNKAYGASSYQEFKKTFPEYIHNIYESMASDGYNVEMLSPDIKLEKKSTIDNRKKESGYNEVFQHIAVNIGRNGEFLFNNSEGHHRLSIARILDIDVIPVVVIVRHHEWQKVRDKHADIVRHQCDLIHEDLERQDN